MPEIPKYRAIREDFFTTPLWPVEKVRLRGSHCTSCGELFLGTRLYCERCGSRISDSAVLSDNGTLWSYTIARYPPPGNYKGKVDPFEPFAVGFIQLREGLRIVSRLAQCDLNGLRIGMDMELVIAPFYTDEEGCQVLSYAFRPTKS